MRSRPPPWLTTTGKSGTARSSPPRSSAADFAASSPQSDRSRIANEVGSCPYSPPRRSVCPSVMPNRSSTRSAPPRASSLDLLLERVSPQHLVLATFRGPQVLGRDVRLEQ